MSSIFLQLVVACLISLGAKVVIQGVKMRPISSSNLHTTAIPSHQLAGQLESYPNVLGITHTMQDSFHPVVMMDPKHTTILDLSQTTGQSQLIPFEDQQEFIQTRNRQSSQIAFKNYTIGKYDEDRINLYSSELFENDENQIDGYHGARTLHVGVDLGAPAGAPVYSFWDGVVHSVGYNSDLGDYGYVIVVEYDLSLMKEKKEGALAGAKGFEKEVDIFWILYGHLDKSTTEMNQKGKIVKRGDVLGSIGDVDQNGGW